MELAQYQDYEEYKKAMNTVLNRTVEDFVMTGYLLKQGRDTDILKDSGYSNVNEFAWAEYKLEATQVSRYIRINDRFSEGGYSPRLQEHYKGFGYAKLADSAEELRKDIEGVCEPCIWFDRMQGDPKNLVGVYIL